MELRDIRIAVGPDRYQNASAAAYRAALHHGTSGQAEPFDSTVAHEIADIIWDAPVADNEKVKLTFDAYADIPCYALLMYIALNYSDLSSAARDLFWDRMRSLLGQDTEALAGPVEYTLWCDYFEGSDAVEQAWAEVVRDETNDRALQRVLIVSGPVPFAFKEDPYTRLIEDKKWHYYIFRSLLHSTFDYFGNIEKVKALGILQQLDLPPDTDNLMLLRHALQDAY